MALRIEKASGVSLGTLVRMQDWYHGPALRRGAGRIEVKRCEPA